MQWPQLLTPVLPGQLAPGSSRAALYHFSPLPLRAPADQGPSLVWQCHSLLMWKKNGKKKKSFTDSQTSGAVHGKWALTVSLLEPVGLMEQTPSLCPFPINTIPCDFPIITLLISECMMLAVCCLAHCISFCRWVNNHSFLWLESFFCKRHATGFVWGSCSVFVAQVWVA